MRATLTTLAVCALALSCKNDEASSNQGLDEPLRVQSGQFVAGALPGAPEADASTVDGGVNPQVTDVNVANTAIAQGELGLVFSGHAAIDAQTAGVRFADLGTGYWVVPVGAPDPSDEGLLTWQVSADFGRDLPPGFHELVFAAIGADGSSGTQSVLSVCIDTPVPDNLNVCVPKRLPPAAVLSLDWDAPVDLDLVVETPDGKLIGGKTASRLPPDAGAVATSKSEGALDRDSNAGCVIDDIDRENVVWQSAPAAGEYQVWVDLFGACGQPAVRFTVTLWIAEAQADGTKRLVKQPPLANGLLVAAQANGGSSRGLFVGDFVLK